MTSTPKRIGRPYKPFETRDGKRVNGLRRRSNGRWVIVATGQTFREPDERLAVMRFHRMTGRPDTVTITAALADAMPAVIPAGRPKTPEAIADAVMDAIHLAVPGSTHMDNVLQPGEWTHNLSVHEPTIWAWVREQIISRPKYVAEQTGIEQIGYLDRVTRRQPSATLDEVWALFSAKPLSPNWMAKCEASWKEFCDHVEVTTLRELEQDHFISFDQLVIGEMADGDFSPTYARQRYQAIRSILAWPAKRGKWTEDAQRAANFAKVLRSPRASRPDPHPITPETYKTLLKASSGQMTAILLLMLNCCMYAGEAAAVEWSELDLDKCTLRTRRGKTNVVRIATLWPRTVAALRDIKPRTDHVFLSEAGTPQCYLNLHKQFVKLRKAAELKGSDVQLSHVRDGSYTAAVEAGISLELCQLLAGHATGISDFYVQRRPQMVAEACEAIDAAYFG